MDIETISRTPLLPNEECLRCIERWQNERDRAARDKICRAYYRLACGIASEYRSARGSHFEDVVQEGMLGLMVAIDRYDPGRGAMFSTYAPIWVRAYVRSYLRDRLGIVKVSLSHNSRRAFSNIRHTMMSLKAQGIDCTNEELALRIGVPAQAVERAKIAMAVQRPSSTDVRDDGLRENGVIVRSSLEREGGPELEVIAGRAQVAGREIVDAFRQSLTDRERKILDARLLSDEPERLHVLGKRFGVTKERIRQIEVSLKRRLREAAKGHQRLELVTEAA